MVVTLVLGLILDVEKVALLDLQTVVMSALLMVDEKVAMMVVSKAEMKAEMLVQWMEQKLAEMMAEMKVDMKVDMRVVEMVVLMADEMVVMMELPLLL